MHDSIVRALTDVRHVSGLRLNLISLEALDSTSCSTTLSDGVIKVKNGVTVVMKGEKKGTLYRLVCKSVTGSVAVTFSDDHDANNVKL